MNLHFEMTLKIVCQTERFAIDMEDYFHYFCENFHVAENNISCETSFVVIVINWKDKYI